MSKRVISNLLLLAALIAVVWGLSAWQRAARAARLVPQLAQPDDYEAYKVARRIQGLGAAPLPHLERLLRAGEPLARARAATLLGASGNRRYAAAVAPLLQEESPEVRAAAALALGHLGGPEQAPALISLLSDSGQPLEVRTAAARALGLLAPAEALEPLVAVLRTADAEQDAALRRAAVVSLGALRTAETLPALAALLQPGAESDPQVRAQAAEGLRRAADFGPAEVDSAAQTLIAALRDEASEVRLAAVRSLDRLPLRGDAAQQARGALEQVQDDDHYWVRTAAQEALR